MSIELILRATENLPRVLVFTLSGSGNTLSARMLAPQGRTTLCYFISSIKEWTLRPADRAIWCRGAALDLSDDDVARIRKAFALHGMPIEADFPTAAPIGPESAKVASPAVNSSGGRGEAPLSGCTVRTDRGALEDIFDHFTSRFLTANETL